MKIRIQQTIDKMKRSILKISWLYYIIKLRNSILSYYVNKLGGGDTDSLSVGSTTYFKEEPKA